MTHRHLLLAVFCVLTSLRARAETPPVPRDEARSHFQRGLALADAILFEEAVVEFEGAYATSPQPAVLYNIAIAYANARRPSQALIFLRRYLATAGSNADQRRVRDAEARLATLQNVVAQLDVVMDPTDAQLLLDGQPVTAPIIVDPGAHVLAATAVGYAPNSQVLRIAEGAHESVRIALGPSEPKPAAVMALLAVQCNVPDVRLTVDGASVMKLPRRDPFAVKPGTHRVVFDRLGYQTYSVSVQARAATLTALPCKLRPVQPLQASVSSLLRVDMSSVDAQVFLDEEPFSGAGRVPSGNHSLRVEARGYQPWSASVRLEPGRTADIVAPLVPTDVTRQTRERERRKRIWMVATTAGAGLVLSGITTWLVIDNHSRYADWQSEQRVLDEEWRQATVASMPTAGQLANDARADHIKLQDEIAVGTGVASGALLLVAATLFLAGGTDVPVAPSVAPGRATASLVVLWQ